MHVVNFLLVLIELFSLGVMAEALLAKIARKSAILLKRSEFDPKFWREGDVPNQLFLYNVQWYDVVLLILC